MDHYSGGYYLIERSEDAFSRTGAPPVHVWTPSACICKHFPSATSLTWTQTKNEERDSLRRPLHLNSDEFSKYQMEIDKLFDAKKIIWPGVFVSAEEAKEYFRRFLTKNDNIKLIEIALPKTYYEQVLSSSASHRDNEGESAIHFMLSRRAIIGSKGTSMGYEILGLEEGGHFHSLLCNHLQTEYSSQLKIKLNNLGLIEDFVDAEKAAEFTNRDEVGAEPVDWFPFCLISHPVR